MTETPSDARLSKRYDPYAQLHTDELALDAEERRVLEQPSDDDPGDDHVVAPPMASDDDSGYDPLPESA